ETGEPLRFEGVYQLQSTPGAADSALLFGVQSFSEVDADKRFVPNGPRVVPRRNRPHIAGTKLCFGTVVHSDHYPPRDDVDEVSNSAAICPNSRFDTLRPAPSRLMDHALDLDTTQVHALDPALVKGLNPSTAHGSAHLSSTLSNLKKKSVDFFR